MKISRVQKLILGEFTFQYYKGKATDFNGYIEGTIKNNTNENLESVRVIAELYDKDGIKCGQEETVLYGVSPNKSYSFKIHFQHFNVETYNLTWRI